MIIGWRMGANTSYDIHECAEVSDFTTGSKQWITNFYLCISQRDYDKIIAIPIPNSHIEDKIP